MALASVGPYRVLEHLGAGANGEVCLAEDTRLHRRVALKTLSGTAAADGSELRRRLLREARAAARLNHPHIAAVYDVLETDAGVHIVMEYVRGTTLATRIRQGPPTPMQVVDIALQLASALVHAHSLGVIHRDLKPANIVIAADGSTKVLDFGLARLYEVDGGSVPLSGSSELSVDARHVVGTPPYIPPEHLSGARVDARGDIYSLGVTLYELLTGRRPFEASDGMGLTQAILTAPTPRVRSSCPECPTGLDEIVYRAMSRKPNDRYPSAADLLADLKRLSAGITDVPTQSRPSPLFDRRNRRPVAWTAAAILAAVMASLGMAGRGRWLGSPSGGASVREVIAVLPLAGAAGDPEKEAIDAGFGESLAARLSHVPGLTVVPRGGTLPYRTRKEEPHEIARHLGASVYVDGIVEGSTNKLKLVLELRSIDARSPAWQLTVDGTYAAILRNGDAMAAEIAKHLELARPDGPAVEQTTHVEAFAAYARARRLLERREGDTNLDESLALFERAATFDPRFARGHAGIAEAYWRKFEKTREDKFSLEAEGAISKAAALDPGDAHIRMTRGLILRGRGRLTDAAREYEAAIASDSESDDAHRQLGTLLVAAGDRKRGIEELQEAVRLRPAYWVNHAALGSAHHTGGAYAQAAESFKRITELEPNDPRGYSMLGSALHAMDDTGRAVNLYEKAIALGSASASSNLGMLHLELGGYAEAARHIEEAVRRDPNSAVLRLNLADAHAQMGLQRDAKAGYESALDLCQASLRANPHDARMLARLAAIETKLGRMESAARHINEAVIRAPRDPDVNYYHAVVRVRAGQLDDALKALDKALECGYSRRRASADPDLKPLRGLPQYLTVMSPRARPVA